MLSPCPVLLTCWMQCNTVQLRTPGSPHRPRLVVRVPAASHQGGVAHLQNMHAALHSMQCGPTRPGRLPVMPPVLVAQARWPALSSATAPTVSCPVPVGRNKVLEH